MRTIIYFIRHAESLYAEGQERSRGLSERGMGDALRVRTILQNESVDVFVSSPYERAVQTIKPLADAMCKDIIIVEDLRERTIGDIGGLSFPAAKQRVYQDFHLAFAEGESSAAARTRGVQALERLLEEYAGMNLALGTHGDIMTLMLNHFDPQQYNYEFWKSASMPDIYKTEFDGKQLLSVVRAWEQRP
ncbi:histidine phosphatase family protein [Paenibacillus pedocola]|uniref:histidine phosphatase family protein n=1 Tax=Paenibacillus pedocola TaxID=3242193 RepID=UPI002877A0C7|nr:histidine phosphatase family protein [Paenibacillus typhae]